MVLRKFFGNRFIRDWRVIVAVSATMLILIFGVLPAYAAGTPSEIGYPIKRFNEQVRLFFTFGRNNKEVVKLSHATERLKEAVRVTEGLGSENAEVQAKNSQTIQELVNESISFGGNAATLYGQLVDQGAKIPQAEDPAVQKNLVQIYLNLEQLRLSVPPDAQSTVLQAIATHHMLLAVAQDVLGSPPVSAKDGAELTALIAQGFMNRDELTALLAGASSNRELLSSLQELVKGGQIPATALYAINFDLIERIDPQSLPRFRASVLFDEMRKVAIFSKVVTPDPTKEHTLNKYLNAYEFGQPLPRDDLKTLTSPLIYGLNLTPDLPDSLSQINAETLGTGRWGFYQAWQPLAPGQGDDNAKAQYAQLLELADLGVVRDVTFLKRVELEVLKAIRADVAYLALPPGWTEADVVKIQGQFMQSIKDLEAFNKLQDQTQKLISSLAEASQPLVAPIPNETADEARQAAQQSVAQSQEKVVSTATTATEAQAATTELNKQITILEQEFNTYVTNLEQADANTQDIALLKDATSQAIVALKNTEQNLQSYVAANLEVQKNFTASLNAVQAEQVSANATLNQKIKEVESQNQSSATQLSESVAKIEGIVKQNTDNLKAQVNDVAAAQAETQAQLILTSVARNDQIAALESRLNLSDAAREVLKSETETAINELEAAISSDIQQLQTKINESEALRSQLNDTTQAQITQLQTKQTELLDAVQQLAGSDQALQEQVEASVAQAQAARDSLQTQVQNLTAQDQTLESQLQNMKTILDASQQNIKTNSDSIQIARSELQSSIDNLRTTQTVAASQLNEGMEALGTQLRQAIGELESAQEQTTNSLAELGSNLTSVEDAVNTIADSQAGLQVQLQAQASANASLRTQLKDSVTLLQEAQAATQKEITSLGTEINQLKDSVAAIINSQDAAQQQINQLLQQYTAIWTELPDSLRIDERLQKLKQELQTEFAAIAASLEQKAAKEHDEIDAAIEQLRAESNARIQQLEQEHEQLKAQLQEANEVLENLPPGLRKR